jgi:glycosyltransferase involved in cell wall biosynthesis
VETGYHDQREVWSPCHHRWERWTLGLELAALSVHVVHSPDFIPPLRFGRRWARVITIHDLAFLRFPELLTPESRRYYAHIFQAVAEAERIIAVSEATRRDLLELIRPSLAPKIVVVPEGVHPRFKPIDREHARQYVAQRFGIDRPFFLFVGTQEPRKNLPRLVRAFALFDGQTGHDQVDLVLAGGRGWLADDLDDAVRSLGEAVHRLGRVADEDLVELYNAAIALVFVSLYEGFGLPVLEAMACGRPVVLADRGALPELAGDSGILVDPLDELAIAESLDRIWQDEELRAELGARARRRAASYDWATAARETAEVYKQAAACVS